MTDKIISMLTGGDQEMIQLAIHYLLDGGNEWAHFLPITRCEYLPSISTFMPPQVVAIIEEYAIFPIYVGMMVITPLDYHGLSYTKCKYYDKRTKGKDLNNDK